VEKETTEEGVYILSADTPMHGVKNIKNGWGKKVAGDKAIGYPLPRTSFNIRCENRKLHPIEKKLILLYQDSQQSTDTNNFSPQSPSHLANIKILQAGYELE
jgi:hypothetical protein